MPCIHLSILLFLVLRSCSFIWLKNPSVLCVFGLPTTVNSLIPAPQVHHNFQLSIFNFQFSWVSFLIPAPQAHLKPALRIVGGKATDLAVAADENRKAVKKRRRQTLCLRSIRFRLCDSRLRQRCGAWLLRHFCHQKWQRTLRNFVAHKNKSGWHLPLLGRTGKTGRVGIPVTPVSPVSPVSPVFPVFPVPPIAPILPPPIHGYLF